MNKEKKTLQATEPAIAVEPALAPVSSSGKLKNECLFCRSRFCYERVVTADMSYDEIACKKHVKDLHKHSDTVLPNVVKSFISSTGVLRRKVPFK